MPHIFASAVTAFTGLARRRTLTTLMVGAALFSLPTQVRSQEPNVLSESEKAQGWQLMFDGKTMTGWHSFKKTTINESGWIVKDSSIYLRGPAVGALLAPEKFVLRNFEISIDWKIADGGNSGIFLRYLETEASENIRTGPESQVCGRFHADYKGGIGRTSPGACYAMYAPAKPWIKSSDQFNTFHVIMYEDRVAHFGNGIRLLEYVIGSEDWKAKYDTSKYNSFPLYGDIHAGKLFLQDHGNPVWYRNLKIRPLASDPWTTKDFLWPDQTTGITLGPPGRGAPSGLRITRDGQGRILLHLSRPETWRLGVSDSRGYRLQAYEATGSGNGSIGISGLESGSYFLTGSVGGRPYSLPFSLIGP